MPPLNLDRLVGCEKVPLLVKGNWMIKTLILVSNICLKVFGMVNEKEFSIYQSKKKKNRHKNKTNLSQDKVQDLWLAMSN